MFYVKPEEGCNLTAWMLKGYKLSTKQTAWSSSFSTKYIVQVLVGKRTSYEDFTILDRMSETQAYK